jgi:hypothetical protein
MPGSTPRQQDPRARVSSRRSTEIGRLSQGRAAVINIRSGRATLPHLQPMARHGRQCAYASFGNGSASHRSIRTQRETETISPEKTAARLGICVGSVQKLIREGVPLAAQLMPSAPWQIPVAALDNEAVRIGVQEIAKRRPRKSQSHQDNNPSGCRDCERKVHYVVRLGELSWNTCYRVVFLAESSPSAFKDASSPDCGGFRLAEQIAGRLSPTAAWWRLSGRHRAARAVTMVKSIRNAQVHRPLRAVHLGKPSCVICLAT